MDLDLGDPSVLSQLTSRLLLVSAGGYAKKIILEDILEAIGRAMSDVINNNMGEKPTIACGYTCIILIQTCRAGQDQTLIIESARYLLSTFQIPLGHDPMTTKNT